MEAMLPMHTWQREVPYPSRLGLVWMLLLGLCMRQTGLLLRFPNRGG